MPKRAIFPLLLILVGVSTGLLVIFAYAMSGGKPGITLTVLAAAIISIITGSVLAFSRLLDRFLNPVLQELQKDIEDDIQDIKAHRMTNTLWMIIIIGIAMFGFSFFVFRFHKLEATWGSFPVVIPTFIAVGVVAWFIPRSQWFCKYRSYTPMWIFLIPVAGLILSVGLGLSNTENLRIIRATRQESIAYDYNQPTGVILQEAGDLSQWVFVQDLPDCDGDVCVIYLVIGLVILTFVLVAGSAMIPHFWLFSGSILLAIMALITIHDLRIRRSIQAG